MSDGPEELGRMLIKLADGRLAPPEALRLREILRDDPRARAAYVEYMAVHALLEWRFATPGQAASDSGTWLGADTAALAHAESAAQAGGGAAGATSALVDSERILRGQETLYGFQLPPPAKQPAPAAGDPDLLPGLLPRSGPGPWAPAGRASSLRRLPLWLGIAAAAAMVLVAVAVAMVLNRREPAASPVVIQAPPEQVPPQTQPQTLPAEIGVTAPRPAAPPVATVTASVAAAWDDPDDPVLEGADPETPLARGQRLRLGRGFVELTFAGGARMVVEAPASFTLDSPTAVSLAAGRVAVTASGDARGFVVRTPAADVTDLGTQFGVAVDGEGATQVHVFEGQVQAQPAAADQTTEGERNSSTTAPLARAPLLKAGDAGRVTAGGVTITPAAASPQAFVRSLSTAPARLDLTDLLCGGDGTTRRRGAAIEQATGKSGRLPVADYQDGDGAYRAVPGLPVVDGCFVPDGRSGPVKVDSAGHTFAFPPTNGRTFNHLWAGGPVPWPKEHKPAFTPMLGGVDYDQEERGFLLLHANRGVTLDLAAVGRLHPAKVPAAFRAAAAGNAAPAGAGGADLFVLVDGEVRFERRGFAGRDGAFPVDVPLRPGDRFLTLAATDGGDGGDYDWVVLGDPALEFDGRPPAP